MIRAYDGTFAVDGIPLLAPDANMEISESDLDESDSGRDESGYMHRFVAREGIGTWSFSYAFLDKEDLDYIKTLFQGRHEFTFTYGKADDGTALTTQAYCSKRSYSRLDKEGLLYKNLKFNIIEC